MRAFAPALEKMIENEDQNKLFDIYSFLVHLFARKRNNYNGKAKPEPKERLERKSNIDLPT